MQIAILGATGGIGGHVLDWALRAGHPVHALARDPQALPPAAGLTVTRGDALDETAVAEVIDGADAVVSALGPRGAKAPGLLAGAASHTILAMQKTGASRLVCVSAAGAYVTGDPNMNCLARTRGKIARADVAHFIAAVLTEDGWPRAAPALAY